MTVHIAYLAEDKPDRPASVRVVEPAAGTPQSQRGNLYAVVDLRGDGGDGGDVAALAERMLSALQRTYYNARGPQSQVLTEAVAQAQQLLDAENAQAGVNWQAGILCIGVLPDRVSLAGTGDAFAFITTDGAGVNVYPPDRLGANALTEPGVIWPVHRQKMEMGGAILAGANRWLERIAPRTLASTTAYIDPSRLQEAATWLQEQAEADDLPGLLLVLQASPPPPPPAAPTSRAGGPPPRPRLGGLPTALNALPPTMGVALPPPPQPMPPAAATSRSTPVSDAQLGADSAAIRAAASTAPVTSVPPAQQPATAAATPLDQPSRWSLMAVGVAAGLRGGRRRLRGLAQAMLPDRQPGEPPPSQRQAVELATAVPALTMPLPSSSATATKSAPFVAPARTSGGRARLVVAIAAIVLLLVPAVVLATQWRQGAATRGDAESLLELAGARLNAAQDALDQDDQEVGRTLLTEARTYVLQAEEILGRTNRSSELLGEINRELQGVMQVQVLYGLVQPLTTFPAEAEPKRVLVVDQDIYVLDSGQNQVVYYRLDPNGETLAEPEGRVVLREGESVDGVIAGPLLDIAWQQPIPGYEDKANLLIMDANNQVFRYNLVDGITHMDFGAESGWQAAGEVEGYLDRLYVADGAANQVYRYSPGQYKAPATSWFQPTTQVNLRGLRAMAIDGDIWLLFEDGKVVRYRNGEQVPFGLDDSVALPTDPVDMYVGQRSDEALYIADAAEERILFFAKEDGKYLGQYQAGEGDPMAKLRGIFIDEARDSLFVLTDRALYHQQLPR